jgi:hypothetical protein
VTDGVLWAAGRLGALYRIELDDSGRLAAWTVDFGPTHITGWSLGGGGLGTENFRMTFDTLAFTTSAIPEPSTYAALLGLTALALAALRRKTRSRSS